MTDQFAELDNYNPDPFSELDNYDPTPKPAGLGTRAVNTAQALTRLAYDMPGNLASYAANLSEGSRPLDKTNWADQATADATQRLNERTSAPDANDPTLLGTKSDWAQTGASVPFSVGSMGAALGAGGLTTAITKNPFAGYAAGAGAAGSLAYRADTSMFMNSAIDAFTTDYQNKNNGQAPSRDLLLAEQERLQPYAQDHGLWEALPEAAGSVVGGKIVSSVFKGTGNLAWKAGKIAAGLALEELPTETITQHGQHNTEIDAGIAAGEKRSFTSPSDVSTSFGEVVTPVLQQSLLMGGGGSAVKAAYDYAAARKQKLEQTASTGPLGGALANGGFTNEGDHLADSNLDLRTDEQKAQDNASVIDSTAVNTTQSPTLHTSSYDNLFQQAESNYGLPAGLLSTMGFHESGFDPNAVSSVGARGVMQFMPATAQEYGIDPHDTPAAIDAAGKKMAGLVKYYNGDMAKAVAAYNYGEGNLNNTIAKAGDNWQSALPPETQDYLSRILGGQQSTSANNNTNTQSEATQLDPSLNALVADDQLQGTPNPDNVINSTADAVNNSADAAYSPQPENLNGSQKADESTNETSAQEKGSLLSPDALEQSGATSLIDNAPHDPLVSVIDRNTGTAFHVLQSDLDSNKDRLTKHSVTTGKRLLTPILRQDIVDEQTYQQELADQQQRQDEQANQQTETQAQDQTSADQSTGLDENNNKSGNAITTLPDSIFSAIGDMQTADSGLISLNGFTPEEGDAIRKSGLIQIGQNADGTTHEGVDPDSFWKERERRFNENRQKRKDKQNVSLSEKEKEDIRQAADKRANRYHRLAQEQDDLGELGYAEDAKAYREKATEILLKAEDFIKEKENNNILATESNTQDQSTAVTAPLLNKRTNKPFTTQKLAEAAIASSSNPTVNQQDHIAVPVDGGFGIVPKPNTTQGNNDTATETQSVLSNTLADATGVTASAPNDVAGQGGTQTAQEVKQSWEMTDREYGQHKDKEHEARRLENLAKVDADLDTLKNKGEGYDALIAKETAKVAHTITPEGKFSHNLRSGSRVYNSAHDFVHTQLLKRKKNTESHNGKFRSSFATDMSTQHSVIQKAINEGKTIPQNVLDSLPSNFPELKYPSVQETAKKPDWEMTRDEYKNSFDPRDYKDSNYDRMIHGAVFNEKITQAEADKKLIRDYHGNKYHWAKTRKELEQEKKEAVKNAKAAKAEGNKNPIHSVKWAQKSDSNTAKNNITSTNLHHNKLLEVHQERVQEALSEGKSVPQEVLADYPDLQTPVQETANPIHDNADVSKKGELATAKPDSFVSAPDGSKDFGEITPEIAIIIGRESAKIRLRQGDSKDGLTHIEQHESDIKALGFESVKDFISEITHNFTAIYKREKSNSRSLMLVDNSGKLKYASIQLELSEDGSFYEIKNATPGRDDQFKNKKPVWERNGPIASSDEQTSLIPGAKSSGKSIAQSPENAIAEKLTTKGTVVADKAESNIQDFGEKLEGAKKFTYTFKEALAEDIDISAVPLSKSFPQPDYDKLIAGGIEPQVAALIAQLRAEIPTKPSKSYRVSKWVAQVTAIREAADHLLNGDLTVERFIQAGKGKDNYTKYMGDVLAIADSILPSQIRELGNFKLEHTLYGLHSGVKDVWKWSVVNTASKSSWGKQFDTKEEAIAYIKSEISTENTKGESIAKFDRWTERGKPGVVFVGKKIASGKYITLKEFPTSKEALNYTIEHNAELVELLKQKKKDKGVRRAENNQRVGKDYRNGKNVSAKEFTDTFGFFGVQFGNYVSNDRRQQDLNNAYDGLIDLAEVLGIPPKALALNGELGLAFGARGTGGEKAAAAHYEPNQVVINLTKAHGAGSLAHEWWHAVDNYFGKQEGSGFLSDKGPRRAQILDGNKYRASTDSDFAVRKEVFDAWQGITKAIKTETQLAKRSAIKDKTRSKDYYSTVIEMTARTFERYIIGKLADQGYENDYLANIIPTPILEKESELDNEDYAYPLQSEMAAVNKAYDKLFDTLETKETEKGTALFSKSTTPVVNPHSKTSLNQAVTKAMDTLFGQGWTNRLMTTGKFKVISRDEAVQIAGNQAANAKGFFNSDTDITYLVYDNIEQDASSKALVGLMLHEISTHSLNLGKSSEAFQDILRRFEALKATNPKVQAAFANVPASTPDEHKVEEALAEYLQANPKSSLAQRLIEWFRQAVRALGKTLPVLERAKFSQWANKLTEAELIGMATSALKSAPDSLQFDNVGRENAGVKLSLSSLKSNLIKDADLVRNIPITRDQWNKDFPDNKVTTPIGDLKLGENQFDKIMKDDRVDYAGLIKPTLENPAYIIKNERGAKVFIKAFVKPDGKIRGFISISYNIDGIDVVVSNHPKDLKYLAKEINSGELLYSSKTIGPPERGTTTPSGPQLSHAGGLDETITQQDDNSSNNNIKFSRSTPSNTPADNSAMRSFFAKAQGKQALGWLAGLFQRNHLIDFVAQDLPELINYKLLSQEKDNFTNKRENEIGKSYKEMLDKLDKKTMHELGRVQGMATRLVKFDPATIKSDGTPAQHLAYISMSPEQEAVYDAYTAMPESAKEAYATMRKAYQDDLTEKKEALKERIRAFPADKETQAEIIRTIEQHFDQFKEGVYFPLNRDGAIIVKATNQDGELVIEHVATQADAYKLVKEMTAQGYDNTHIIGKDAYDRDLLAGNAANEMAALAHKTISDLKEKSVQGKLTESDFNDLFSEFNQLLINTLPDSSYRKHFIHRKGTLGESTDTLRAYAKTRTSAVKMIASLTYDHQIQDVLNNADKAIKEMDKVAGSDTLAIKSIVNELKLREAALKSTEINAVSQVLTSLGFMGALGFNIGSAAVNMLQVVGVALPELSGRHGYIEATKEVSAAYKLLFNPANLDKASGLDITKNPHLSAIAKQAMKHLASIGKIDLTMTHDSIAAGKNPSYSSNPATRAFGAAAKYSGYFFHVAEAANRQITGMAAFNLAYKKNGGNFEAAIAEAVDVIDRTQFDYGQGNRARYMMSNTARVLTLFKAYALGMSYYIGRNAMLSMKGETPEVRLQALKTLIASMAMSFATAGLFGMPIGIEAFAGIGGVAAFKYKGARFAVPGAIGGMLIFQALLAGLGADDEDELETEFRNWLTDNFDQTTAEWVTKGPARLLPIGDIAGRTSLSELWWRSQNKQLEGTDQYNAIATALIGPIGSQVAGLFTAKKMYEDGQYSRMVESMSPAFLRNAIAANRMGSEGVTNLKGDKIIQRDLTPVELINKVIGFNPTVVTNTYDANSAIAKESTKHTIGKSHLVNRWMAGDATERSDLMKGAIKDFNESVPPSERITLKSLFKSMRSRKGIDKHTKNGLYLSKKQNYLRDIGRFNRQE